MQSLTEQSHPAMTLHYGRGSINLVESDPSLLVTKWALYKSQEQI